VTLDLSREFSRLRVCKFRVALVRARRLTLMEVLNYLRELVST